MKFKMKFKIATVSASRFAFTFEMLPSIGWISVANFSGIGDNTWLKFFF